MEKKYYVAFDIGGTNIKHCIADKNGSIIEKNTIPTKGENGVYSVMKNIELIIKNYQLKHNINGIAISSLGLIDSDSGIVKFASQNIKNYSNFNIKSHLENIFNIPVTAENDVNCAALGEMWKCSHGTNDFIALTIGTGIGGAIVKSGKVESGMGFSAAEFGHITVQYNGKQCICGHRGCYECYASAKALEASVRAEFPEMNMDTFFEHCKNGHPKTLTIYNAWIDYVSEGIRSLVHIFNPQLILIGGGISVQGEYLTNSISESLEGKIISDFSSNLIIKTMKLGNDANLLGAIYHHKQNVNTLLNNPVN